MTHGETGSFFSCPIFVGLKRWTDLILKEWTDLTPVSRSQPLLTATLQVSTTDLPFRDLFLERFAI